MSIIVEISAENLDGVDLLFRYTLLLPSSHLLPQSLGPQYDLACRRNSKPQEKAASPRSRGCTQYSAYAATLMINHPMLTATIIINLANPHDQQNT
jgi:hypothetical protein